MIKSLILVGAGGAAGSILRFLVQRSVNTLQFPYGTLAVNILGCLLIGLLWGLLQKNSNETVRLLAMTGFCGGFTTFSAFTYESLQLVNSQKWGLFFLYLSVSIIGGLLATFSGFKITN